MTDSNLRELERRFRASGSAEDEAAWLAERVRTGGLTLRRVGWAGYLGHEAALRVAEAETPTPLQTAAFERISNPVVRLLGSEHVDSSLRVLACADLAERAVVLSEREGDDRGLRAIACSRAAIRGEVSAEEVEAVASACAETTCAGAASWRFAFAAAHLTVTSAAQALRGDPDARHSAWAAAYDAAHPAMVRPPNDREAWLIKEEEWQRRHLVRCLLDPTWPDWRSTPLP